MTKEALKLALEAIKGVLNDAPKVLEASISGGLYEVVQCRDAITAIKEALAQPEQDGQCKRCTDGCPACDARKLPQRTWVGLTDEEWIKALELCDFDKVAAFEFFEAKLKEKNK